MEANYPLEVVMGLLVLFGLLYMGDHPVCTKANTTSPAAQRMATTPAIAKTQPSDSAGKSGNAK